jgi:hypothetical protein
VVSLLLCEQHAHHIPLRSSIACPTDEIQASDYVTDSGIFEHHPSPALPDLLGGTDSASQLWKTSAQTIGEILVLSDIINPLAYAAQPLVNPAFYFASCCYIKGVCVVMENPAYLPSLIPTSLARD